MTFFDSFLFISMPPEHIERLKELFHQWSGAQTENLKPLPQDAGARKYYRIQGGGKSAIGAVNQNRKENIAFLTFSKHFKKNGLLVPEIYAEDLDRDVYLEEDLGDITLFSFLTDQRKAEGGFPQSVIDAYQKVIEALPWFQIHAGYTLDYSVCSPRPEFDRQSMLWDLHYFKYYFLKLANIAFDEQALEQDYQKLIGFLLRAKRDFFLYRDFQSRNVMLKEGEPYFIDYQGGRKGALQYDIASLLYDAKAAIPPQVREALLAYYRECIQRFVLFRRESFDTQFYGFVFLRLMQAMGAYGYRGFYEQKTHFLQSVPYVIQNLEYLLEKERLPVAVPELTRALQKVVSSTFLRQFGNPSLTLTLHIQSFSYKRGIPRDLSGHGGGFVFDCRSLPNPARIPIPPQFVGTTGKDSVIIEYFQKEVSVERFLESVEALVGDAIENYQKRKFTDLSVAFGCTGGEHRSVYAAERLARAMKEKYDIQVEVQHRELE